MQLFPLTSQIDSIHFHILDLCDSLLSLNQESKDNNKSKAEAYILYSFFVKDRFNSFFGDLYDMNEFNLSLQKMGREYFALINISPLFFTLVSSQRQELYNEIDAKKYTSIVDKLGANYKYLNIKPTSEFSNPEYDRVKDNPLYQLITKTVKSWYHTIRGMREDAFVNEYDYEKWIHFSTKAFSELGDLIYNNPLGRELKIYDDPEFIYAKFGFAFAHSLISIDKLCIEIKSNDL